ncbi:MAG: anti-sigma factor [Synechococcaceae cyanobacterium]|nr:anti-sigma factor [Synechococcaceae cyanobacterium]
MTTPDRDPAPLEELLAGHALGDLDEAEREQVQRLLRADPSLRERVEELSTTLQLLPLALGGEERPPARLRRRLLAAAQEGRPRLRLPPPRWGTLVTAAMACALVVMGVQVRQLRLQLAQRQEAGEAASRILVLHGNGGDARTAAQVLVHTDRGHNTLVVRGLPPAPPRHVYRLWADVEGRTVGCVRFLPDDQGQVAMPIPSEPSGSARSLRITLEPLVPDGERPHGPALLTTI